jgi:glycosyltransferase involved in cell wall biosynthesis
MRRPAGFDRDACRRQYHFAPDHVVCVFVALGHFERKGLKLLLSALGRMQDPSLRLLVVGGNRGVLTQYESLARKERVSGQVHFTGMQSDVRPFLWMADAFVFPSAYEVFSLALLEAAAARLPLVIPALNGTEEFVRDGVNGFLIERSATGVCDGLRRLLALYPEERQEMGHQCERDVAKYSVENFVAEWRAFYRQTHVA